MKTKFDETYLKQMKIILSFFFKDEDVKSVIYDYQEQLDKRDGNEMQHHFMKMPIQECRKVINETEESPVKMLLMNNKTKMLLMLIIFIVVASFIASKCERNDINFLIPAISLNFIFFIIQSVTVRNEKIGKQKYFVTNILILVYVCLECMIVGVFMPNFITANVGYIFVDAIMTISVIGILLAILTIFMNCELHGYLLVVHHVITVFLISLYFVGQIHIMQDNALSFSLQIIKGAILIYCESIVFQLFRIGVNKIKENG